MPLKWRRDDGQPIEKEPRLAFDPKQFTRDYMVSEVFKNAKEIQAITNNSLPSSHIIVFDVSKQELDIWDPGNIAGSLQGYSHQFLCAETYQASTKGQRFGLSSISGETFRTPRRRLQKFHLLFMYKTAEEHMDLSTRHREDSIKIWKHILELSTKMSL